MSESPAGKDSGKRVAVIGAGIAGLVTAKVLAQDGFDVAVFEKQPAIGGVWSASHTYPGLRANNPRETYAFSDYPYPETADEFPTAEQIRAYLESYTDHFGLRSRIRLRTQVVSVVRAAAVPGTVPTFQVSVRGAGQGEAGPRLEFDFVVVCNGVFSEPQLPRIDGRERFAGAVLHSSQLIDPEVAAGKRVLVVGAGKSALDCATWAAQHGTRCTLLYRRPHWMVPRYFFERVRFDRVAMTRFGELFLRYHRQSRVESLLHGPARALVRVWWWGFGRLLRRLLRMPAALVPDVPLPVGFEGAGIGGEFYEVLREGKLTLRRTQITRFTGPASAELATGETIEADVVVLATGWRQGLSFLDADLLRQVESDGRFRLYRHILPPRQPRLGFVGYASSTANQLTSEIAAHWLSQCFRGELSLPPVDEMEREISRVLEWAAEVFPGRSQGYFIGGYLAHYLDDLLRDMGLPRRRAANVVSEYFGPIWGERYRDVPDQRRRRRAEAPLT